MRNSNATRREVTRMIACMTMGFLPLVGCKDTSGVAHTAKSINEEWVGATELFKNPEAFVTKARLRFYLTRIGGATEPMPDIPDHFEVLSGDVRQYSSPDNLGLVLTPAAHRKWLAAQLGDGDRFQYGVTFSGKLKSMGGAYIFGHVFLIEEFEVNDETLSWHGLDSRRMNDEYRPAEILSLPRPVTIAGIKELAERVDDFAGRVVRFDVTLLDESIRISENGRPYISTQGVFLEFSQSLAGKIVLDSVKGYVIAHVIGQVVKERDQDGRVVVIVESLLLHEDLIKAPGA